MVPYDRYVRFLITAGESDSEKINEALTDLGLFAVLPTTLEDKLREIVNSIPDYAEKQRDNKKFDFNYYRMMKPLDVQEAWSVVQPFCKDNTIIETTRLMRTVIDINYDVQMRFALRALIFKNCDPKDICQDINQKFSFGLKEQHVHLYRKYFWDPSIMRRQDWKNYLKLCGNYEKALMFNIMSSDTEVIKAELGLPTKINVTETYQKLFAQIQLKVQQYMAINSPETNSEARKWIKTLSDLGDKYKKYEKGSMDDFGKLLQLEFQYTENDFPMPDEMTRKLVESKKPGQDLKEEKPSGSDVQELPLG